MRVATIPFLVAPLLGACAPPDGDGWQGTAEALGIVDLARLGPVRLHPDGDPVADGEGARPFQRLRTLGRALSLEVVDTRPDRVAVLHRTGHLELTLWVERGDAWTWVVAPTEGGARRQGPAGVWIAPGVPVEVVDRSGEEVRARVTVPGLSLRAWVPRTAVDQVRRDPPADASPALPDGASAWLAVPSVLRDGPDGARLGRVEAIEASPTVRDADPVRVVTLGPPVDGFVPVAGSARGLRWQAWVAEGRLVPMPRHFSALGASGWGRAVCGGSGPRATILAGALLYDDLEGEPIGEALDDHPIALHRVGATWLDGWHRLEVSGPWGDVPVWVGPGDLEGWEPG